MDQLEAGLLSGSIHLNHEKFYSKYYEITETSVRRVKLTPNQEAISAAEKNYGYFALLTNDIKDPLEALQICHSKNIIERAFGNLKERLNLRCTSVSSEENLEGKLFVQFLALIYLAYIDRAMGDNKLYRDYNLRGLLDGLDVIERFEHPGHKPHIGEVTKKQVELYELLGVPAPS